MELFLLKNRLFDLYCHIYTKRLLGIYRNFNNIKEIN